MSVVRLFVLDERGATAIEYALIAGLVFLAVVGAITNYTVRTNLMYSNIANNMR